MELPPTEQAASAQSNGATTVVAPPPKSTALVVRERPLPTELPAVLSTTPNVAGLLQALRRRWKLAMFLGIIVGAGAAAGTWFSLPEKFTARTLVLVDVNPKSILGAEGRTDSGGFQRTQVAYIKSRLVLNAALNHNKVKNLKLVQEQIDPLVWLDKYIQADFATAPEILRIHMTGDDPKELVALVDAVREAYVKEATTRESGWRTQRLKLLNELYNEAARELTDKKNVLKGMAEKLGSAKDSKAMALTQQLQSKTLDNLQSELVQTQAKLRKAKMEFEILKEREKQNGKAPLPQNIIEEAIEKDAGVLKAKATIANLERNLDYLKKNLTRPETDEAYKNALAARKAAQEELHQLTQKLRTEFTQTVRDKIDKDRKSSQLTYQDEIAVLESMLKWFEDEFKSQVNTVRDTNKAKVDVEWLSDEIKLKDDLANRMQTQIEHLQIEMKAPERYTVLEEGYAVPDQDTRIKKAGMAGGGALALILFAISFLEFRSRRVNNADEVIRGLKMRFVGALPSLRSGRRSFAKGKSAHDQWQNQLAESIETTRTVLLHAAESEALKLIVVTSAVGGEGKTLTCSHLAASLARAGRKTLLIDADLRRPAVQRIFGLKLQPGFAEMLRGEADLAGVVQAGPIEGLSIIAAGGGDDQAIQALSQPILSELFKQFREQYEFVIVDSAPILPVADSQVICQQADGVVFTILRDVSRLPQIYAAHERLTSLRIRILGAVVNGADGPVYGSTYPYSRRGTAAPTA